MCILIAFLRVLITFFILKFSFVSAISSAWLGASQLVLIVHLGLPQATEPLQMGYSCSLPVMSIAPFIGQVWGWLCGG